MRTIKTRTGQTARIRGRIPAAREGRDAPAESAAPAEQDAGHAVATLYQLHYPALVRLAALLIPDLATAEEIVQNAFAAVHRRWHVLPDADAALAYLRWSVVHQSRSVPPPEPAEGTGEPGSAIVSALRALSARQREVVVLRYFADLPEAAIAAATGMSMAAVREHAARAMSSLQADLNGLSRRDVADVDHHPVRAGQGRDVVRPPGGQAEAEAQVTLEVARRLDREQSRETGGEHGRPGPGAVRRLRAVRAGPAEDDVQVRPAGQGDLRSLRIGVDRLDPFGSDGRDTAGELEHHPVVAGVLARPDRGQVRAWRSARAGRAGLPVGLLPADLLGVRRQRGRGLRCRAAARRRG